MPALAESTFSDDPDAIVTSMDVTKRRLPAPSDGPERQVFQAAKRPSRRGQGFRNHEEWVLKVGLPGEDDYLRRTLAWYYPAKRHLVRRIASRHLFGNKPGIAWNLELLQRADQWAKRPHALVCLLDEPKKDGSPRAPYKVEWEIVRAFAHAALDGDDRWTVDEDIDTQLLIPFPAWSGAWTEPPPPRDPELDPVVEAATLFDLPEDPKPIKFRHSA